MNTGTRKCLAILAMLAVPIVGAVANAQTPPPPASPAVPAPEAAVVAPPAVTRLPVTTKFAAELYGFAEFDAIYDTTQGLNDVPGNGLIAHDAAGGAASYTAHHPRLTFSPRNSRIGIRLKGPDSDNLRPTAILEMDFFGNQSPTVTTEAQTLTSPVLRIRHAAVKLETPMVDILAGQFWQLFGWQPYFMPNTVSIQGVSGEVFSRSPQLRLSHLFKGGAVAVEIAAASARPPQRDGGVPDGQGGVRLTLPWWKGVHTIGSGGTAADALAVGLSGVYRVFNLPEFSATPAGSQSASAGGFSVDVLLPVVPSSLENRGNGLILTGSFVRGTGIADLYAGLTGGSAFPALPNPMMTVPAPAYMPNVDPGMVVYDAAGVLHTIDWQSFIVGVQYYLPPAGKVWVSANYSQMSSANIADFSTPARVFKLSRWADGNLFWDVNNAVRLGAEFAYFYQRYADEAEAKNLRAQLTALYLF